MEIFGVTVSNQTSGICFRLGRERPVVISFFRSRCRQVEGHPLKWAGGRRSRAMGYFCLDSHSLYFLSTSIALSNSWLGAKDVTYLMSLGRQCPPTPVLASGMSTFHFVFSAFRNSSKSNPILAQVIFSSSAKAICRNLCAFSVILHISATSTNETTCIGIPSVS